MKKLLVLLVFGLSVLNVKADQLAYISKADAEKAVAYLQKNKKVILFCGCCSGVDAEKVKVTAVEARYTNYENYYEVYITYKDKANKKEPKTVPVDLAYLWVKHNGIVQTLGKVLDLDHDPCTESVSWKLKN
ncbi:MAG: hypothetical protein ACWA41_07165 [Putridiphycobacter sp.]